MSSLKPGSIDPKSTRLLQHQALSSGVELEYYCHPPTDLAASTCQQHLILVHTEVPPATQVEQITGKQYQT